MQPSTTEPVSSKTEDARDLQSKLYREIGISAVAAALRFTTQPEPAPRPAIVDQKAQPGYKPDTIAA